MRRAAIFLAFLAGCAEPGKEVRPTEGAFAFLEMKLGS